MNESSSKQFSPIGKPDYKILASKPNLDPDEARARENHAIWTMTGKLSPNWGYQSWGEFCMMRQHQRTLRDVQRNGWDGLGRDHQISKWVRSRPSNQPVDPGSLRLMANALHKNDQAIRRFCKAGLIPFARECSSGRWRIDYDKYTRPVWEKMIEALRPIARTDPAIKAANDRYNARAEREAVRLWDAHCVVTALTEDLHPEEDTEGKPLPAMVLDSVDEGNRNMYLAAAVSRVQMKGLSLNAENVAAEFGISRRTGYRKYRGLISQAIERHAKVAVARRLGFDNDGKPVSIHEDTDDIDARNGWKD